MIFQEIVQHARRILQDSDSLEKRYNTLIDQTQADKSAQDTGNSNENRNVVQQVQNWRKNSLILRVKKVVGRSWLGYGQIYLYTSPLVGKQRCTRSASSQGEFITHISALLWHCGIEKSILWPVEDVTKSNAPATPQNNNAENNSVQPAQHMRQVEGARERDDKQGILTATMTDGGHRSGLVNGHGNAVRGMRNLGNRCYFNAVLQSILALDKLRMRMLGLDARAGSLCLELKKLFEETSGANGGGGTLVTDNLFEIMRSSHLHFKPGVMEDSNNLLGSLLLGLNEEEPTMVELLFRGQLAKHVLQQRM